MATRIGTKLGSHEITALLGKGGMGEVYRARDLKLKREVAIKILPDEFSRDADRITRFQREAEVLASLNHPNIAAIYDLEEADRTRYLVLELVEGETLADRVARGPIPIDEALKIARSICEALEAAHEKGVVHRDLKPANIKLTADGNVKVLDFGLAKALESGPAAATLSNSPTMLSATMGGMIVGTAAYMAPEQARGRAADQRSDIFSFGCVLYEMLTGKQAFHGEEVSDVLAAVLRVEPDFTTLRDRMHPSLLKLLKRCLEKNPKNRWYAVGDVRFEIEQIAADSPAGATFEDAKSQDLRIWQLISAVALIISAAVITIFWMRPRPADSAPVPMRFSFNLDADQLMNRARSIALSPDGAALVYATRSQLYLKGAGDLKGKPIRGTNLDPRGPFFSPDGRWIGFATQGQLYKVPITGGAPVLLCELNGFSGADWNASGQIFFGSRKGILRISENGGNPEIVAETKPNEGAAAPEIIPGTDMLLFSLATDGDWDGAQVILQSLKSRERKTIIRGGSEARYIAPGYLLYAVGATLFAVPFDGKKLEAFGTPTPILEDLFRGGDGNQAQSAFATSSTGAMAYVSGASEAAGNQIVLIDRNGGRKVLDTPPGYGTPRVSPDGTKLMLSTGRAHNPGADSDISIYDLKTGAMRRLTFGGNHSNPMWSADGRKVLYGALRRDKDAGVFVQRADGGAPAESVVQFGPQLFHFFLSKSGKLILNTGGNNFQTGGRSWLFTPGVDDKPKPLDRMWNLGEISPDEHWVVYESIESGRWQVYVEPFPPTGTKNQISDGNDAAHDPIWSSDGKQIFYLKGEDGGTFKLGTVDVQTRPSFSFTKTTILPLGDLYRDGGFDVSPDGKYFVFSQSKAHLDARAAPQQINITLNWFEELKQRVPRTVH